MERSLNKIERRPGLLAWLAIAIFLNIAGAFAFFWLATSSGGNPIGAGIVASLFLVPVPILLVTLIVVGAYRGWKHIQRGDHRNEI